MFAYKIGEILNKSNIIVIKEQYYFYIECLFTELENVKFGKYFYAFFSQCLQVAAFRLC